MGSTSSKDGQEGNVGEMAAGMTNKNQKQFPLQHHPQYGAQSAPSMNPNGPGGPGGTASSGAIGIPGADINDLMMRQQHQQQQQHQRQPAPYGTNDYMASDGKRKAEYMSGGMEPGGGPPPSGGATRNPPSAFLAPGEINASSPMNIMQQRPSDAMEVDENASPYLSYMSTSLPNAEMMGEEDGSGANGGGSSTGSHESASSLVAASANKENDVVPMVFRWEHGGRNVFITGTFNGWSKQCPMHRSGNDFTYIANLTRGKHAYKFVVDDEWRFAPDQLTVADVEGNVNNFVDVSDFVPLKDFELDKEQSKDDDNGDNLYGRFIPDIDEYTKEPPPLPPHLRHIILNKVPPAVDSRLLPVPQHVALNHLYCTAIKDGMMVLGITQRYKQKFVTTVYYSLMPGAN